jgi:hypothetical protein
MNPYLVTGPAMISFSGGRTSGYMLHQIVQAHGGTLPPDVRVAFANTGKEREETLRFVHECGSRWGVDIHWLEWRRGEGVFEKVGFNSASRNGEPFADLITKKSSMPRGTMRFCSEFLKVRPLMALATSYGWVGGEYSEVIGLRYDEGHRILKGLANADRFKRKCLYPLSKAKVRKADVMAFWAAQPFDLGLEPWEGNCDLCFLKGAAIRRRILRDRPHVADWWIEQEQKVGYAFTSRETVTELVDQVRRAPTLFDEPDAEEYDVECGLHCATDEAA